MSERIKIALPVPVAAQLRELAASCGEPPSTLASQMVRHAVALAAKDGKVRRPRQAPVVVGRTSSGRARWLEPYGGDTEWRDRMWGSIVALHGRYPRALGALKHGWWNDESHVETLCALATWRAELDDKGEDPRHELAFQAQLADYSRALRQEGGGVTKAWKPGVAPRDWEGR